MRYSYLRVLSSIVLAAYLASCGSLPKPISLPSASPLFPDGERRHVLIAFNTEGAVFRSTFEDIFLDRLRQYWGSDTKFPKHASSATINDLVKEARKSSGTITDIVVVESTLSGNGSDFRMIIRDLAGMIAVYDSDTGKLISKRSFSADVSIENGGLSEEATIIPKAIYAVGIMLPVCIVVPFTIGLFTGFSPKDCWENLEAPFKKLERGPGPKKVLPIVYTNLVAKIDLEIREAVREYAAYLANTRKPPVLEVP